MHNEYYVISKNSDNDFEITTVAADKDLQAMISSSAECSVRGTKQDIVKEILRL